MIEKKFFQIKIYILLGLLFGCGRVEIEPDTLEDDVILTTQQQVDSFGSKNYSVLNGSLQIGPSIDIRTLDALNSLTKVNGKLIITETSELPFIDGFDNLESITDALLIKTNKVLFHINGFNNLKTVGGLLGINYNEKLFKLDGFSSLNSCDKLQLKNNVQLRGITGFSAIKSLRALEINDMNLRDYLTFLSTLEKVERIDLVDNYWIKYLRGLKNIKELKTLNIENTDIYNLRDLKSIEKLGNISLHNTGLINFSGLERITTLNSFILTGNHGNWWNNQGFKGLENLIEVEGDFVLETDQSIFSINYLANIQKVSGDLVLRNLRNEDLNPLANLEYIGKDLRISSSYYLTSINDLGFINQTDGVTINGDLNIQFNQSLTDISQLSTLKTVKRDVIFENNEKLTDFCGLENLIKNDGIEGSYSVKSNGYNPSEQDILDGNCKL